MDATLNITWAGQNGDLVDRVPYDIPDAEVRRIAAEAVSSGSVPGVRAEYADFSDFMVDRYPESEGLPNRLFLRPKTPFGR